jgi:hypothetical protein
LTGRSDPAFRAADASRAQAGTARTRNSDSGEWTGRFKIATEGARSGRFTRRPDRVASLPFLTLGHERFLLILIRKGLYLGFRLASLLLWLRGS